MPTDSVRYVALMDDRSPKPARSGFKLPVGSTVRGASPLAQTVRERLLADNTWSFFAQNGKWICPFCLSAVAKRQGRSREDSIALHLEGCRGYGAGRGAAQNQNLVAERMHFENMTFQAESNPSWRVYDHEGVWHCPSCLERILAVRLQGGQLNNFVFQAMASHLRVCPSYHQGVIYAADDVIRARDLSARTPGLAQLVSAQLQFSVWRYVDRTSAWVCPCCLSHVAEVTVREPGDWQVAVEGITRHLLLRCPNFSPERFETQPEPLVQQSASQGAPVNPAGASPSKGTPSGGSNRTGNTPPQGKPQQVPSRQGHRSPPIARPAAPGSPARGETVGNASPGASTATSTPSPAALSPPAVVRPSAPVAPATAPVTPAPAVFKVFNPIDVQITSPRGAKTPTTPTPATASRQDIKIDWDAEEVREPSPLANRQDVQHARDLQATMLAQSPELPGFTFATHYQACSDITGDFYEFIALSDGRIGFALGDVSGHGVQAGLIMSMAKKTLEIYASLGAGPADTLAKVNDALTRDLGGKMFISMIYGILDPEAKTITWARAGGTPAVRYNTTSGELVEIRPPGMVLGMKAGAIFRQSLREEVTTLASGDAILLYTDGVSETMNHEQEEWGLERLFAVVKSHATSGPDPLLRAIMSEVDSFRGSLPVHDDMTLLALAVE
jgi:hypothetical protein